MKITHVHENVHGRHGALIGDSMARWVNDNRLEPITNPGNVATVKVYETGLPQGRRTLQPQRLPRSRCLLVEHLHERMVLLRVRPQDQCLSRHEHPHLLPNQITNQIMFVINLHGLSLQFDTFTGQPTAEQQTREMVEKINTHISRLEGSPQFKIPENFLKLETQLAEDGLLNEEKEIARETPNFNIHGEDPDYSRVDWQTEVGLAHTQLGYWDWVAHSRESLDSEPETEVTTDGKN